MCGLFNISTPFPIIFMLIADFSNGITLKNNKKNEKKFARNCIFESKQPSVQMRWANSKYSYILFLIDFQLHSK